MAEKVKVAPIALTLMFLIAIAGGVYYFFIYEKPEETPPVEQVQEEQPAQVLAEEPVIEPPIELPEESSRIDQTTANKEISTYEAEEEILGFNHATVGRWLCEEWHLPNKLSDPIAYHHKPNLSRFDPRPTAIVHAANVLVKGIGFGFAGDNIVPQIDLKAWEALSISDSLLEEIIKEMDDKLEDAEDLLSGDSIGI